ncbi:ATP-binding protein [Campylobacter coli]|nr:ATP-binding protein [Campylobacter coli]
MSLILTTMGALALAGTYYGFKKKDPQMNIGSCFFDKLATPLYTFFNEYHSNSLFLIDSIKEDHIICNTPYPELYGIEIFTKSNLQEHFVNSLIDELVRDNKDSPDAFFYYVIHKQDKFQKQYIFSHNKIIVKTISKILGVDLLSGVEICNALYNQFLQNSFYVENKQIKQLLTLEKINQISEPEFMSFKRLAKQSIRKNYNDLNIFQGFNHLNIKESNISSLFKLNFEGSIWFYIDISSKQVENHISKLISYSKLVGDKTPFIELKENYKNKTYDLAIINAIAYLKNYDEEVIGTLGNSLKTSFIPKEVFKSRHLQKNPIKYRDIEFDYIVEKNYLYNFFASVHKKNIKNPDIYGIDKNGAFVNYSFSEENFNAHSCIIAKSGGGKSVSKQKIIAQMIGLNFSNGECSNLGKNAGNVRLRSYDIGFSDENFINLIKSNPKNNVAQIKSDFFHFSYNLVALPSTNDMESFNADLEFNTDLVSIILESQNSNALNSNEAGLFKSIIKNLYYTKDYQRYRIRDIRDKDKENYEELLNLGYDESTFLQDIKEEKFDFLKTPLLNDVIKFANKEGQNQQLKENDRNDYLELSRKLDGINKLEIFSNFDKMNIKDVDILSMDLNNFKESSLFVPIFLCIFQKTYLKDREYAIKLKNQNIQRPKLFYAIEEAANYFRIPHFVVMFEKLAREARKYNVHLCFITQNANDIPKVTLKNIDTRIFLLSPEKKLEAIDEAKETFNIPKNVEIGLVNTEQYEMCVWYSKGVFHMKFEISDEEMRIFSTNPNEA